MRQPESVLVVGASVGGLSVAEALRREGFSGQIRLLGAEPHLPYDRPPLSKKVLAGDWAPSKTLLRTEAALAQLGLEFVLADPAARLDIAAREVETASGRRLRAEAIVLATGLEPRRLPGQERWSGVHMLRTLDDAMALRADLLSGPRLVIVGEGVLGTEIAATARGMGIAVTLVGPLSAPLSGQLGPKVGGYLASLHAEHGVALRMGVGVQELVGKGERVGGVRHHESVSAYGKRFFEPTSIALGPRFNIGIDPEQAKVVCGTAGRNSCSLCVQRKAVFCLRRGTHADIADRGLSEGAGTIRIGDIRGGHHG